MSELLFDYKSVVPMTWVYFSSLLAIAIYFKFSRLWSLRNLDLVCLILLTPGLVTEAIGREEGKVYWEHFGYIWLFAIGGLFLIRLLLDPMMVRRPLLEPNLSVGGMTFLGIALLVFLMARVATVNPNELNPGGAPNEVVAAKGEPGAAKNGPVAATAAPSGETAEPAAATKPRAQNTQRPGYPLLHRLRPIMTQRFSRDFPESRGMAEIPNNDTKLIASRLIIIVSHLAVVFGLVMIGYWHFDNIKTGIAAAVLYLMLPYMPAMMGRPDHVVPAAFLVWAIALYRRPMLSGMFIGLAAGMIYYPLFLLPLWISFYWQRGLWRFCLGIVVTVSLLVGLLALNANDLGMFVHDLKEMFGLWLPITENLEGFWRIPGIRSEYRLPVLALFVVLAGSFALWPAQKNLGTLMSCTAALMLGAQFWHAHGGGLFMAWYLPLLLLTVFRPNLEDRIALSVISEGWVPRRSAPAGNIKAA
ncbi:MAG: hypothetical protein K8T91_03420 [Planctomycetes bacterium]|nr:hypothetical protein [Planctomycetota bacterium]